MGHWGFMIEAMLAVFLIFGIIMIAIYSKTKEWNIAIKIIAWILLVTEIVVIFMFVFTLWLGIWPLIIGSSIVLLIVFIMIATANKGGG